MQRNEVPLSKRKFPGFTLIELLVVMGVLSIVLSITLSAINPLNQFAKSRDTKRRSDVEALANAIHQYSANNGGALPQGLSITETPLSNTGVNVCDIFVPEYIAALPQDPSSNNGARIPESGCSNYDTGYTVTATDNFHFIVTAPSAEIEEEISEVR